MSSASPTRSLWRRLGWLAGLPVLGLVWAGVTSVTAPFVAASLTSAALREAGPNAPWLRLEIRGRDLLVSGEAPEPAARQAVLGRLSAIEGLRRLVDATDQATLAEPRPDAPTPAVSAPEAGIRLAVERRADGGVALLGDAVPEAARAELLAAAAVLAEGASVEVRLRPARALSGSADATALAGFALRLAGLLEEGNVRYEASGLSVSGKALDPEAANEIDTLMRDQRPSGIASARVAVSNLPVSPYRVRIRREAEAVTLSGHLPDSETREAVLAALRPRLFDTPIRDRTRLSQGAPSGLAEALRAGIVPLTLLASGEIIASDRSLRVSGESLYPESARRLNETGLSATPPGWQASVTVSIRDAAIVQDTATCKRLFSERVAGRTLRFAPGSSELKPDFYPLLDALADLAGQCRNVQIVVTGHGDPAGTAVPKPVPLPEAQAVERQAGEASKKPAPKNQPPKNQAPKSQAAGPAKPDSAAEPVPEPEPDLPRARALAIVDYLQKAGVAHVSVAPDAAPLSERQGIGLALRS